MVPCSQCGAPLDADGTTPILTCAFCHQKTVIPDDLWRRIRTRQTPLPPQFPPTTRIPMWIYIAVPAGTVFVVGAIIWGVRRASTPGPHAPHGFATPNSPCDTTRAEENDPCNINDSACSMDAKSELRCNGVKWVRSGACKGPDGCTTTPAKEGYTLSCDDHVADLTRCPF